MVAEMLMSRCIWVQVGAQNDRRNVFQMDVLGMMSMDVLGMLAGIRLWNVGWNQALEWVSLERLPWSVLSGCPWRALLSGCPWSAFFGVGVLGAPLERSSRGVTG